MNTEQIVDENRLSQYDLKNNNLLFITDPI
jgi:hypothetical protein